MEIKHYKRHITLLIMISLSIVILLGRLAYIQLISTESFSSHNINLIRKSIQQRQQQIVLHSGRGEITDRYGQALTGKSTHVLALFPLSKKLHIDKVKIEEVAKLLNVSSSRIIQQITEIKEPKIYHSVRGMLYLTEEEANIINQLDIPGLLGLPYELRYNTDQLLAQHFIGYIGQNSDYIRQHFTDELAQGTLTENSVIGISGIEKTFQPFLQGVGTTSLSYYVDGKGYPLKGMDVKYIEHGNPFYPLSITTTLDVEIQEQLERSMEKNLIQDGTAIILDAETSEIMAISSRPNFMNQMGSIHAWENKALKRFTPGSIFKIVVAAAAIEKEIVKRNDQFQCDGVLEGTNLHCWRKEGHGKISFEEGFAHSCNIVFGQLARQLGPEVIEEYATKLGLLDKNGWQEEFLFNIGDFKQLDGEEQGQVFSNNRSLKEKGDGEYILQTGIGQLDVQVTPLAVANMLATITKGGNKHQVKGVRDILYQTGGSFYHFDRKSLSGDEISPYTAYQLQRLLAGVVDYGTASTLKDKSWTAAGKTGTAQVISKNVSNNSKEYIRNHKWFAGYYPRHQPRYVIVVVSLNQAHNSRNMSLDVFSDMVDWLEKYR